MPRPIDGSRILVTGASSGIGEAAALALAARGARLALTGRDPAALDAVTAATDAVGWAVDLTVPGAAGRLVRDAVDGLGGLDVVISNAGAGWAGPFAEMDEASIDALVDLNLRAPLHLIRAAVPSLAGQGGRIVIVGSIAGLLGVPGEAVYSATKAALGGLAESLRQELAGQGVGVTLVSPGVVDTAFFHRRNRPYARSRPRPIAASRVAQAIIDGIERERAEVVVPGWLTIPARLRGATPGLYRNLAARFG